MNPDALAARLTTAGVRVDRDVPVADLSTYHVGGPVAVLARAGSRAELSSLATAFSGAADGEPSPPLLVVGRGSNLLVADSGFAGLGLVLDGDFDSVELEAGPATVRAGAAVALPVLARAAGAGRTGLEFYVGIPGTVGGAVRMNAGGHGRETADVLVEAEVADLATGGVPSSRPLAALGFGYRCSALAPTEVVTGATFRVVDGDAPAAEAEVAAIVRWRREHQPGGSNAGSVFANPPGDSAGRLVDSLGLKGLRVGGAVVSPKHANFFQAEAGATADDVRRLVVEVRRRVLDATGIELVPELRMVGFEDPISDDEAPRWSTRAKSQAVSSGASAPTPPARTSSRAQSRQASKHASLRRRRLLVLGLVVVVLAAIAYGVTRSPLLAVDTLQVRGTSHLTTAQVVDAAGIQEGDGMVWIDTTAAVDGMEALPYVRDASVTREWPDTVRITVHERTPAAWIDGPAGKAVVDRTGRVLEAVAAAPPGMPQLLGAKAVPPPGGTVDAVGAARVAGGLTGLVAAATTSVEVTDHGIVLHMASGSEVRMGEATRVGVKIRAALAVLDALHDALPAYVDVSVPTNPVAG